MVSCPLQRFHGNLRGCVRRWHMLCDDGGFRSLKERGLFRIQDFCKARRNERNSRGLQHSESGAPPEDQGGTDAHGRDGDRSAVRLRILREPHWRLWKRSSAAPPTVGGAAFLPISTRGTHRTSRAGGHCHSAMEIYKWIPRNDEYLFPFSREELDAWQKAA